MTGLSASPDLAAPAVITVPRDVPDLASLLLVLAGLFAAPPEEGAIAALREGAGADLLDRLAGDAGLAAPIAAFRARLAGESDAAALARRLGPVFGRLYLGLGGPETVGLYESVHRCGGRLFQAPVGEMDRLLAAHDLSVGFDREPADHLSIETALLAHLVANRHPDRLAVVERLRGWVPAFRDGSLRCDEDGFFAAAADLLAAAIERAAEPSALQEQSRKA